MVFKTPRVGGNARFCSRGCYLWVTESALQREVREALDALSVRYDRERRVGRYNVDFYLPDYGAALEVDGEYWHGTERQKQRDSVREPALLSRGLRVLHVLGKRVRVVGAIAAVREVLNAVSA